MVETALFIYAVLSIGLIFPFMAAAYHAKADE